MKPFFSFLALVLVASVQPAQARGGLSSGGISPPAPRAVVIQENLRAGERPDRAVERAVRELAEKDLEDGIAVVFKQERDGVVNGRWRVRWCVEYTDTDLFFEATTQFKEKLNRYSNTEVVSNGACR